MSIAGCFTKAEEELNIRIAFYANELVFIQQFGNLLRLIMKQK